MDAYEKLINAMLEFMEEKDEENINYGVHQILHCLKEATKKKFFKNNDYHSERAFLEAEKIYRKDF